MNYKPNKIQWRRGDIVIHDADAKEPKMLMRVVGFTRDRDLVKTQYIDKSHKRTVWKNPMESLHDPVQFGLVRDPWAQPYLERYQSEFEAMRWWNRTYTPGVWVKTMSADGNGRVCRVTHQAFMQGMSAYVHLEVGGNWLLRFVVAVPDPTPVSDDMLQAVGS